MHLPELKGWVCYGPSAHKFFSSAWAVFPVWASLTKHLSHLSESQMKKMDIKLLVNNLEIGKFDCKEIVKQQDKILEEISNSNNMQLTPKTYKQSISFTDRHERITEIDNKLCNMPRHNVFEVLPLPQDVRPIGGGWAFVLKPVTNDKPAHFKAQYVARGNYQLGGLDFHNTFAPTATFTSLWVLLTLAAQSGLHVSTFDFVAAYLNASIDGEIWIRPPEGLMVPTGSGCQLRKDFVIICLHIDNGVVFSKQQADISDLWDSLCGKFEIKWEDKLHHIIGIDIKRTNNGFHLSQMHLILSIIDKYWDQLSLLKAPLPVKHNLTSLTNNDDVVWQPDFISVIGALIHVTRGMQTDIAFSVNLLKRNSKFQVKEHWYCLQHLLGYLSGTSTRRLSLTPHGRSPVLEVYLDASWGGEFSRTAHGYITRLSGCSIAWCSKHLVTVTSSSCHTEFMALGIAARHGKWI
ncbi:hypothetical protein O181_014223 [Austropuccinia psidii MF-1]|uniref:Reverse transcriptase Ty1/copia-type domain-containing protein n=1 Tax=Austropuccinia psidii MF-1 TaxID=1389203 RepID=A0A9Q3C0T6_9BASI|nr:hypothetical protein [Austropuccinia psidii MF-1]